MTTRSNSLNKKEIKLFKINNNQALVLGYNIHEVANGMAKLAINNPSFIEKGHVKVEECKDLNKLIGYTKYEESNSLTIVTVSQKINSCNDSIVAKMIDKNCLFLIEYNDVDDFYIL